MRWSNVRICIAATLVAGVAVVVSTVGRPVAPRDPAGARSRGNISQRVLRLPVSFIGVDEETAHPWYFLQGRGVYARFDARGVDFRITRRTALDAGSPGEGARLVPAALEGRNRKIASAFRLEFAHANARASLTAAGRSDALVNLYSGGRDNWKEGLRTYARLIYKDLWPGIDLTYAGAVAELKYTFVVHPGADPSGIRLRLHGIEGLQVNVKGQLEMWTSAGRLTDGAPYVYQETPAGRHDVAAAYELFPAAGGVHEYGFRLGQYDRTRPLMLDPAYFVWAGFLGYGGYDRGLGVELDPAGNAYATGELEGSTSMDVYVAKVAPNGSLVYMTVLAGSLYDGAYDIVVDSLSNAYLTGSTDSPDYPRLGGPDLTHNGDSDAFLTKLGPLGTIVFSGFIGGSGFDFAEGVALDLSGNIYVVGPTNSTEATFPVKVGPDLTANGSFDLFVAKIKPNPTAAVVTDNYEYCGFIGGSGSDMAIIRVQGALYGTSGHIAVDASGAAYVNGTTNSDETTFPVKIGPDLTYNGGKWDAFVAKVMPDGSGLVYAGYIGGRRDDYGWGMKVDAAGNAYTGGTTYSTEDSFPVSVGPDLSYNGGGDGFVAKVRADGSGLLFAGYIGGRGWESVSGLDIDAAGAIYAVGHTHSNERTLPVIGGPDLTFNSRGPNGEGLFAKVRPDGTGLELCGYIGGSGEDALFWGALDGAGDAVVVGDTDSDETTFPDGDGLGGLPGPDPTFNGVQDGFIAKISFNAAAGPTPGGSPALPPVEQAPSECSRLFFKGRALR